MAAISYLLVLLVVSCVVQAQVSKTCEAGVSYVCHGTDIIEICENNEFRICNDILPGTVCTPGKANANDRPCAFPVKCTEEGLKPLPGAGLNQAKLCSTFSQCTAKGNNLFDLTYHECAEGYEFCQSCKKCMPKEEANCSQDPLQVPCVTNKKVADASSCDIYWLCNADHKFVQRFCNTTTPHFDRTTGNCVNNPSICEGRKDVYSVSTTPSSGSCEYGQRFAVNTNCRQYDECDALLLKVRKTCYSTTYVYQPTSPTIGKCVPFSTEVCALRPYK